MTEWTHWLLWYVLIPLVLLVGILVVSHVLYLKSHFGGESDR